MQTESLRLFVLASEMLNISAAGRELGMAPAVASVKLAKLEKELGADLLHRSTRKVTLSMSGVDFLPYAKEMLAQEDSALAALGHGRVAASGLLRFAAPSSFAQLYIAPLLPEFHCRHPEITLDLRLTDTLMPLIEGSFDLALRNAAPDDSSLKGRKLADDIRILCASQSYLEQHGNPQQPDDLNSHHLIAFKDIAPTALKGSGGRVGEFNPRKSSTRLIMDDGISQKNATVAGAGISMNSQWCVHQELRSGLLVRVLPDYKVADDSVLNLVYPKSNVLTAKVRVLIDFLLEKIGETPLWSDT